MGSIFFTLGEARLSLYQADANGAAMPAYPVWFGACAENLRIGCKYSEEEIWLTGNTAPIPRHEGVRYDIDIGRVWNMRSASMLDFNPGLNSKYALVITWQDEKTMNWHQMTFNNVMADSLDTNADGQTYFLHNQKFHGYLKASTGGTAETLPAYVVPGEEIIPDESVIDTLIEQVTAWTAGSEYQFITKSYYEDTDIIVYGDVLWPEQSYVATGTYNATTVNVSAGEVDSYTITYIADGINLLITQDPISRDESGRPTNIPALIVVAAS